MSQTAHKQGNPRNAPTAKQKAQQPPIVGVSPDDPIGVKSDDTGKTPDLRK